MGDTAAHRHNWADSPRCFVNLCHDLEMGKGVVDFKGTSEVLLVTRAKGMGVIADEIVYHFTCFFNGLFGFVGRELTIGDIVGEMGQNFGDIFFSFENARPKVFIRRKDDKFLGAS